jgi:hypothetical protein
MRISPAAGAYKFSEEPVWNLTRRSCGSQVPSFSPTRWPLPRWLKPRVSLPSLFKHVRRELMSVSVTPPKYTRLPYGTVKPTGWAMNMAKVEANGLGGHLQDWYS